MNLFVRLKDLQKKYKYNYIYINISYLMKWLFLGLIIGLVTGGAATAFYFSLNAVTGLRSVHSWLICLLPIGGILIVCLYRVLGNKVEKGTNLVLSSISAEDRIAWQMAPAIFLSSVVTHLFGGSAGREGAALQLGGSISQNLGRLFRVNDSDSKIVTMCGMAAAFSAIFGTPLAAAFLAMEITSVGVLYYSALVPCVVSSLTAHYLAISLGALPDAFSIHAIPDFTPTEALRGGILAILCALLSIFFCLAMGHGRSLIRRLLPNAYLRAAAGGIAVILLTLAAGSQLYSGSGISIVELAIEGEAPPLAFLIKLVFTVITIGAGFKGGTIVPAMSVGAAFGCSYANMLGFNPALCSAIGLGALFCGVTNCPIASLMICFELFGYHGMPYYLTAIALSYTFSGYYGLFGSQKIMYSKYFNHYVNKSVE